MNCFGRNRYARLCFAGCILLLEMPEEGGVAMFIRLKFSPFFDISRIVSDATANIFFGWLLAVTIGLMASSSVSAGIVFNTGTDPTAAGDFSAVRYKNFSGTAIGNVYIGKSSDLGSGGPRGSVQNVAWSRQTYDFSYTYDPVQKMATTTWTGQTSLVSKTSYQSLATIPSIDANEMSISVRNTGTADLILNLNSINSVGRGGVLSGSLGGTTVTGGTEYFTGASWNGKGLSQDIRAYSYDLTLYNSGFTLFGTIQVGALPGTLSGGESSRIEIGLASGSPPPVVPEPSTFAMSLGLAAAGWRMIRRRRGAV